MIWLKLLQVLPRINRRIHAWIYLYLWLWLVGRRFVHIGVSGLTEDWPCYIAYSHSYIILEVTILPFMEHTILKIRRIDLLRFGERHWPSLHFQFVSVHRWYIRFVQVIWSLDFSIGGLYHFVWAQFLVIHDWFGFTMESLCVAWCFCHFWCQYFCFSLFHIKRTLLIQIVIFLVGRWFLGRAYFVFYVISLLAWCHGQNWRFVFSQ